MATTDRYTESMTTQQEVSNEYRVLEKGMIIAGHKVLRCKRVSERVVGETYASWIALCEAQGDEYHKWVTWTVIAREKGFIAESGHYFMEIDGIEKAVGSYEKRGGW